MGPFVVCVRIVLAAVFAVAGIGKLCDLAGSRRALVAFGLPEGPSRFLGVLLPVAELAVALTLIPVSTASWAAAAAVSLLTVFTVAIGVSLTKGELPDCHCFGQFHSGPVGWRTLVRNTTLLGGAALVLAQGRGGGYTSATAWMAHLDAAEVTSVAAAGLAVSLGCLGGWFGLEMLKQHGGLLRRIDALEAVLAASGLTPPGIQERGGVVVAGLPVGAPAPAFSAQSLGGDSVALHDLLAAGVPLLLLFTDPQCGPCDALMPEIAAWQRDQSDRLTVALVASGERALNQAKRDAHGLVNVLVQHAREVSELFKVTGTPAAVLVTRTGEIASAIHAGPDAVRALLRKSQGKSEAVVLPVHHGVQPPARPAISSRPPGLPVGWQAPGFDLSDPFGGTVSLTQMRGRPVLLLFWNPGCGFCQRMLEDLKAWELQRPRGAPELVIVASGSAAQNLELGLRSTIALDSAFEVAPQFDAAGTPMAVLIDAQGRVASPLAAGADAVLSLAGADHLPPGSDADLVAEFAHG